MARGLPTLRLAPAEVPTGDYRITFSFLADAAENAIAQLRLLVSRWIELGSHGGFPHPRVALYPLPPLELVEEFHQDGTYVCRLFAGSIDSRAFQLIRNMAGRLSLQGIDVRSVVIEELGEASEQLRVPIPTEENESNVYPALSPHLEFRVEFEDSDWSKLRRCLVQLRSRVEARHVMGVSEWIRPWTASLEAGAYAMPVGLPAEIHSLGGFTAQFDEISIEISVLCFKASEMGWNTLMNSLSAYARRESIPLSIATID
jgi:hypothetical protein